MRNRRFSLIKKPPSVPVGVSSFAPEKWAGATEVISDDNLLWRQYVLLVELYRFYIDLIWKVSIWFYTATGLSLGYFFTHYNSQNRNYLPLLLIFLGCMGIGISVIFSRVIRYVGEMGKWLEYIAVSLRLPGRPHVEFMLWFCRFAGITFLLIAVASVGFFAYLQG
jgi:hypothetical protein